MSEMKNYRILCLFTCYNRLEKTRRCIESLKAYENIHIDFIVVDDASRDGTPDYLVYKLIAKDTIEEKILKLQEKKAALLDSVTDTADAQPLTREEILELLR